jgi:hypothetical protein
MSKTQKPSKPDNLIQSGKDAGIALTESELAKVAGGQDVTVNKAKTADKAFKAMDAYIRG